MKMRWNQKLNEDLAREIATSQEPAKVFVDKYGISKQLVSKIRNRNTWTKVDIGESIPKTRAVTGRGFTNKEIFEKWKAENK